MLKRALYIGLAFLSAAILLSISVSIDTSRAADDSKITVAYSANLLGYLEPCG